MKKGFIRTLSAIAAVSIATAQLHAAPIDTAPQIATKIYTTESWSEEPSCFAAYSKDELSVELAQYYTDDFFDDNMLAVYYCVFSHLITLEGIHYGVESVTIDDNAVNIEVYINEYEKEMYDECLDPKYVVAEIPLSLVGDGKEITVNGKLNNNSIVSGDIIVDGVKNIKDLSAMCKFVARLSEPSVAQKAAADVYIDGKLDVKDLSRMCRYVAGFEVELGMS